MSKSDESRAGDSSPALVVYKSGDLYSAATQAGVAFYNYSLPAAQVWLIENGFDAGLLDSPVDGLTWRSTLTAAFASELESIDLRLDQVASTEDVEDLKAKQLAISASIDTLSSEIREEKRVRELAQLEAQYARAVETMFSQWPARYRNEPRYVALVHSTLRNSPLGRRIQELR